LHLIHSNWFSFHFLYLFLFFFFFFLFFLFSLFFWNFPCKLSSFYWCCWRCPVTSRRMVHVEAGRHIHYPPKVTFPFLFYRIVSRMSRTIPRFCWLHSFRLRSHSVWMRFHVLPWFLRRGPFPHAFRVLSNPPPGGSCVPPPSAVSAFCFHFPPRGPFPHAFRVLSNHRPQPCAPDVARCPPLSPVFHVLFPPALLIHFIIIMISIIIINSVFVSLFDYLIIWLIRRRHWIGTRLRSATLTRIHLKLKRHNQKEMHPFFFLLVVSFS